QPRIATAARCGKGGQNFARVRVELLNAVLRDLKQMPSIESRARVRGDVDGAHGLASGGIESIELVARREPNPLTVVCDSVHRVDAWKGSVLAGDFGS